MKNFMTIMLLICLAVLEVSMPFALGEEESVTEITLERSRCYGPCPVYKATLRRDGKATYIGKENVALIGKYKGMINQRDFDRLAEFLSSRGFFTFKEKYSEGWLAQDIPTVITSAVRNGKRKTVKRKTLGLTGPNAAPAEMIEIEKEIDAAVERIKWEKD
jgi:hypothetical protein